MESGFRTVIKKNCPNKFRPSHRHQHCWSHREPHPANLASVRRVRAYLVIQAPQPRAVTPQAAGQSRVEATAQHLSPTQQLQLGHHPPVSPFQALWGIPIQAPSPPHSAPFTSFLFCLKHFLSKHLRKFLSTTNPNGYRFWRPHMPKNKVFTEQVTKKTHHYNPQQVTINPGENLISRVI